MHCPYSCQLVLKAQTTVPATFHVFPSRFPSISFNMVTTGKLRNPIGTHRMIPKGWHLGTKKKPEYGNYREPQGTTLGIQPQTCSPPPQSPPIPPLFDRGPSPPIPLPPCPPLKRGRWWSSTRHHRLPLFVWGVVLTILPLRFGQQLLLRTGTSSRWILLSTKRTGEWMTLVTTGSSSTMTTTSRERTRRWPGVRTAGRWRKMQRRPHGLLCFGTCATTTSAIRSGIQLTGRHGRNPLDGNFNHMCNHDFHCTKWHPVLPPTFITYIFTKLRGSETYQA